MGYRVLYLNLMVLIAMVALSTDVSAGDAFLHPKDKIMWVGDSITAQNIYEPYVMRVLGTLYPDAGFLDVNGGVGGATAPSRFGGIPPIVEKEQPTIMTVMFGVNDTGWGTDNEPQKIETYSHGLQQYADLAKTKNIPLLFLRETHFSHNIAAQPLEIGLDGLLMKLFAAQEQVAKKSGFGVVDVYGAYTRELAAAWKVDPKYEFTPNFVHPTMLGHCAVAGEILKSLGAGLPLARDPQRGPLHVEANAEVELSATAAAGVIPADGKLAITIHALNHKRMELSGDLIVVIGKLKYSFPIKLSPNSPGEQSLEVPASAMTERWAVQPIYIAFRSGELFAAGQTPIYYSHAMPTADAPYTHSDQGWVQWEGQRPATSTVGEIKATVAQTKARVEFTWTDSTPVPARAIPFKARLGEPVTTPLDMSSPFGQPCDAVEVLWDLREVPASGRYTSNMDSIPSGTARVGLYRIEENGKPVAKLQVSPEAMTDAFRLHELGGNRFAIEYSGAIPSCGIGLDMMVTDAQEYAPNKTSAAWLTSARAVGVDWMDFIRLAERSNGIFCRVGY